MKSKGNHIKTLKETEVHLRKNNKYLQELMEAKDEEIGSMVKEIKRHRQAEIKNMILKRRVVYLGEEKREILRVNDKLKEDTKDIEEMVKD